jgi:hypothetical protein
LPSSPGAVHATTPVVRPAEKLKLVTAAGGVQSVGHAVPFEMVRVSSFASIELSVLVTA